MMAWVWISLVALAQINTAEEPHRDADGGLAGLEALFSDSEPPVETRSRGKLFPVPVWKFLKGSELADGQAADFGRPQYRCSGGALSVRLSLIRHSDLRLEDGSRSLSLPDGCRGSVRTFGPWLLLKLPYTSCPMALWISNGTWFRQLKLRYFDHLLQANVMGVAACENPATSLQLAPPLVSCRTTDLTVKLPHGTRLKRVKALGKDGVVGRALTTTTPDAVLVQISTPANTDSIFEVTYFDSTGEMSTMLADCFSAVTQSGRDRHPRALKEPDQWALWDFEEVSLEQFIPGPTATPCNEESTNAVTTQETFADSQILELWGFDETTAPHTTSASCATSTTSTTTKTSAATTTGAAPTTTSPSCATSTTTTCANDYQHP